MSISILLVVFIAAVSGQNGQNVGVLINQSSKILMHQIGLCRDVYPDPVRCQKWKAAGMCTKNPAQMHRLCRASCGVCRSQIGDCINGEQDFLCDQLARTGNCNKPQAAKCYDSCKKCPAGNNDRLLSVYLTTWNAANQGPKDVDLVRWTGVSGSQRPDIVVLGMQEMGDQKDWLRLIHQIMTQRGYLQVKLQAMGQITEVVYMKAPLAKGVTGVQSTFRGTGIAQFLTNKGGVIIRLNMGETSLAFVTSHLAAGQKQIPDRIQDFNQIVNHRLFGWVPKLYSHDYVFWQGDLNFRINHQKNVVENAIKTGQIKKFLQFDQLLLTRNKQLIFQGFEEAPINFSPTYKFDQGTDTYDTSAKQRVPSWTDRILWRENKASENARVWPYEYYSLPEYKISDHKPVVLLAFITI